MKTSFRKSFARDLKKIKDRELLREIAAVIEAVEAADGPKDVANLAKMEGSSGYYRIRIGDFRIGLAIEEGMVNFIRCLSRRDLYRYFP